MKKTVSTSGGYISIDSKPNSKNHMRYRSAKEFPTIWDFARLCSFNRLEVMIKKVIFVLHFLWRTNLTYKKTLSSSGGNISINSKPILKNDMRYRSAKEFPTIWDFAQLCSFNCLEVMSLYPSLYENFLPR